MKITEIHFFSLGPSAWIPQGENICYGPENTGSFEINGNKTLVAIRLVHLSGGLTCKTKPSNWGCQQDFCADDACHGTHIKRSKTNDLFPDIYNLDSDGLYTFPGFNIDDDLLIIKLQVWPTKVSDGEVFDIYYQGYRGTGIHCIRADASFLI